MRTFHMSGPIALHLIWKGCGHVEEEDATARVRDGTEQGARWSRSARRAHRLRRRPAGLSRLSHELSLVSHSPWPPSLSSASHQSTASRRPPRRLRQARDKYYADRHRRTKNDTCVVSHVRSSSPAISSPSLFPPSRLPAFSYTSWPAFIRPRIRLRVEQSATPIRPASSSDHPKARRVERILVHLLPRTLSFFSRYACRIMSHLSDIFLLQLGTSGRVYTIASSA